MRQAKIDLLADPPPAKPQEGIDMTLGPPSKATIPEWLEKTVIHEVFD